MHGETAKLENYVSYRFCSARYALFPEQHPQLKPRLQFHSSKHHYELTVSDVAQRGSRHGTA
jgi:hypothetical protein